MPIREVKVDETSLQYYLIAFDAAGNERDEAEGKMSQKMLDVLSSESITDVFIFSHGWLGDFKAACFQYNEWVGAMSKNLADIEKIKQVRPGFRPLLIGLHWPSKPWGDEELKGSDVSFSPTDVAPVEQLIEHYAERIADTEASRQALKRIFQAAKKGTANAHLPPEVREAYEVLNQEASLGSEGVGAEPGSDRESFDAEGIFEAAAQEQPVSFGIGSSIRDAVLQPLRVLSFWKMKDRARQFGETGSFQLLKKLQQAASETVRFHLMGHSFGCIVVSATLAGRNEDSALARPVNSVVLVQGALSHWSYCSDIPVARGRAGYFHSIIAQRKVDGPIITTQTRFDTAIRIMYRPAARIANQIAFPVGKLPKYGALGTFGARGPGVEIVDMEMLPLNGSYQFEPGKVYNLESSKYICGGGGLEGAHNNITEPEVAHAVWAAAIGN